jgi:hypothetical protein
MWIKGCFKFYAKAVRVDCVARDILRKIESQIALGKVAIHKTCCYYPLKRLELFFTFLFFVFVCILKFQKYINDNVACTDKEWVGVSEFDRQKER